MTGLQGQGVTNVKNALHLSEGAEPAGTILTDNSPKEQEIPNLTVFPFINEITQKLI